MKVLRHLVLNDVWLKLFSVALAALVYFTINLASRNELSPVVSLPLAAARQVSFANLPVLVMSPAEDVRSVRISPKEVEVTVEGDSKILSKLKAQDIRVLVDLTRIQAAHDLRERLEVSAPPGVTLVRVDPEEVQVIYPVSKN
jgi:YbbR domain-containing protein